VVVSTATLNGPAGPAISPRLVKVFMAKKGRPRPTSGGSSRRSTGLPPTRCESTISSMSLLST
jgi:hypothetical protein